MKRVLFFVLGSFLIISCSTEKEKEQKALMEDATIAGDKITTVAFQSLSGHLKGAMATGGIEKAINYCNIKAIPLTDSISGQFDVNIRRTSVKLRNPANSPDSLEQIMLNLYQDLADMRKPLVGKALLTRNNDVRYFAPITMQPQCLQCHGTVGEQVTDNTYTLIKSRYPADQATGYEAGQLRGIWSVNFGTYEDALQQMEVYKQDSLIGASDS